MKNSGVKKLVPVFLILMGIAVMRCGSSQGAAVLPVTTTAASGSTSNNPGGYTSGNCPYPGQLVSGGTLCEMNMASSEVFTFIYFAADAGNSESNKNGGIGYQFGNDFPIISGGGDYAPASLGFNVVANDKISMNVSGYWDNVANENLGWWTCPSPGLNVGQNAYGTHGVEIYTASDVFIDGSNTGLNISGHYATGSGALMMALDAQPNTDVSKACLDVTFNSIQILRCFDVNGNNQMCP